MSSAAAAADAPEEFAALADYTIDDFMSEAASDVEIFATTEGYGDVSAEEIRFLARDPQAHDRVMSRVARLHRRVLRRLLRAAGFDEPVWQTRIRWATAASLPRKWASGTAAARHRSASSKRPPPRKQHSREALVKPPLSPFTSCVRHRVQGARAQPPQYPATRRQGREFLEFLIFFGLKFFRVFSIWKCIIWELVSGRGVFLCHTWRVRSPKGGRPVS
jgi:hypothetical protein